MASELGTNLVPGLTHANLHTNLNTNLNPNTTFANFHTMKSESISDETKLNGYEYPVLKQSYIFDFYRDHVVVSLNKHNITGIHPLKKEIPINGIIYDNNCRISTNKGFIIEILYAKRSSSFIYRLIYENVKIKYILDSKGTKEDYDDLTVFLDYIVCELLNQE